MGRRIPSLGRMRLPRRALARISHGQSTVAADSHMPTALRSKNDFDVLVVRLHPFFFSRSR